MKKFIFYLLIGLISLTPLLWFKGDLIIAHGDDALFLNPGACFNYIKWSWDTFFYNCGGVNNSMPLLFPVSLFWHFLSNIGIGLSLIERFWLVLVWFITGISMFYLGRVLGLNLLASLFAVILYLLNIFSAQQPLIYNFRLPYMVLPLFIAFIIKGLNPENSLLRYIIYFSLGSLLMCSAWTNPPWVLPVGFLVFSYILYSFIFSKGKRQKMRVVYFSLGAVLITFLLNIWWIIPYLYSVTRSMGLIGDSNLYIFKGRGFYEIFRFLRSWAFGFSGYKYHDLYYNSWIIILTTYLIPIIVFLSLFRNRKGFKDYYYFIFLSLGAMFLVKGPLPPMGSIYEYLFHKIPGFVMFREPYTKFTPIVVFGFAILFGDSIGWICDTLNKRFKHNVSGIFGISVVFLIFTASLPIFGKSIFWQTQRGWRRNKGERSSFVKIPAYWTNAGKWAERYINKGNLFSIPRSTGVYEWSSGFNCSGTPARYLFTVPIIDCSANSNLARQFLNDTYRALSRKKDSLYEILRLFNVSYILHDKDIYTNSRWQFYDVDFLPPRALEKVLKNQEILEEGESIGHLNFYKIVDEYYLPKIYTANNISYIYGDFTDLAYEQFRDCYQGNPAFLLDRGRRGKDFIDILPHKLTDRITNYMYTFKGEKCSNQFVIPCLKEGDYDVFLELSPRFSDQIITSGLNYDIDLEKVFSTGQYKLNSVPGYKYEAYPFGLSLEVEFDEGQDVDEYIQVKDFDFNGKEIDIDLAELPFMGLCYRVEDPNIQMLQLVMGVDVDKDNKEDITIHQIFEIPAPAGYSYLYYNVNAKAQQMDQRKEKKDKYYHVVKIELYPHKIWGASCIGRKRDYGFWLKKFHFFESMDYKNRLWFKDKIIDRFLFLEKDIRIDVHLKRLELPLEPIDLIKYNQIEFLWKGYKRDELIDVKLILDLDGDRLPDREEVVYAFNVSTEKVSHTIDFRNVLSMGYDNVSSVNLLAVHWISNNIKSDDIRNSIKRFTVYNWQALDESEFGKFRFIKTKGDSQGEKGIFSLEPDRLLWRGKGETAKRHAGENYVFPHEQLEDNAESLEDYAFSLNGEKYKARFGPLDTGKRKDVILPVRDVYLKRGDNTLVNFLAENDPLIFKWICFKNTVPHETAKRNLPGIEWKKINPTKYLVDIKEAGGPFLLVFSETFNKEWKAYKLPDNIELKDHILVNGYAQGWWIDGETGNLQILIKYKPQDWNNVGWIISGMTLIGCLITICKRKK